MNNVVDLNEITEEIIENMHQAILDKEDYEIRLIGSMALLEQALEGTGYHLSNDWETNGWEVDWWGHIVDENDKVVADAHGSMYYGNLEFTFINE